jgi:predicted small integral membrane protein
MDGTSGLEWMAWTGPTAAFFVVIGLMLAGMTVWGVLQPTTPRRGLLPMETTRGDRLFIGLLASAYLHLAWLAFTENLLWIATVVSLALIASVMRWG